MKHLFILFFSFLFFSFSHAQSVVYVTQNGSGNQSGGSWSDALPGTQLQSRLASAGAGTQFWIASGTYKPTTGTDRSISFSVPSGVQVYGGFAGNEATLANRTLSSPSSTTLSGEIGDQTQIGDNTYHVVRLTNVSASTRLDGLTITGGNANVSNLLDDNGGGIFNTSSQNGVISSPVIANCSLIKNRAFYGAGMYNGANLGSTSNPTLLNCLFSDNGAERNGGGFLNTGYSATANPVLTSCTFRSNFGSYNGGGLANICPSGVANPTITACSFEKNATFGSGGAIYNTSEGSTNDMANPIIRRCTFTDQQAYINGGAICSFSNGGQANMLVEACAFLRNTIVTSGSGGAVFLASVNNTRFINCLFTANVASKGGTVGTSVYNNLPCIPAFVNCTFAYNQVRLDANNNDNGSGVFYNSASSGVCNPRLTNCLLWENGARYASNRSGIVNEGAATVTVNYSDVQGGFVGTGNINQAPTFVNSSVNDFHLLSVSPAINTGDPGSNADNVSTTDLDGAPRIVSNRIDMGAYEFKARFGPGITVYVTPTGSGNMAGTSWSNALPGSQLQQATIEAQNGTSFWVASGTYKPTNNTDRTKSFWVPSGGQIYGGFNGTETALSQRNINTNPTTLSGDIGIEGNNTDNSYNVVRLKNAAVSTRLDGFIIRNGKENRNYDNLSPYQIKGGGAVYNDGSGKGNSSSPTIANCEFISNEATYRGGALFNDGSDYSSGCLTAVQNCKFDNNYADLGGAIFNSGITGISSITLSACMLVNNRSSKGAAIYGTAENTGSARSNLEAINCLFQGNSASLEGGAIYIYTAIGGISKSLLTNCLFTKNTAVNYGGAITINPIFYSEINPTLINCTLTDNNAGNNGRNIYSNVEDNAKGIYQLANSILRGENGISYSNNSNRIAPTYTITYSNIQGGFTGTGNIDADPQFVDAANGDYRLKVGSPAINAGDPGSTTATVSDKDLAGNPRIMQDRVDMGVYEFQATSQNNADLSLNLRVNSRTSNLNQPVTYQLTITNEGPTTATNIGWQNRLPDNLAYVGGSNLSLNNGVLSGQLASLAAGASATFTYQLSPSQPGQYRNAAQITAADQPDPDSQPNSGTGDGQDDTSMDDFRAAGGAAVYASANPNQTPLPAIQSNQPAPDPTKADLSLAMFVSNRTPKVGEVITVSITVSNAGGLSANGVTAQLALPPGVTFVSGTEVSPFGNLGVNASVTRTLQLRVTGQGSVVLRAEVSGSDQPDPDSRPNSGADGEDDTATVELRVQPAL